MGYFNIILLCYFYGGTNAVCRWAQLPAIVDCTSHLCLGISGTGFPTCVTLACHNHSPSHCLIITDGAPTVCQNWKAAEGLQDYPVISFYRWKNYGPERVGGFSGGHTANWGQSRMEDSGLLTLLSSSSLYRVGFPVHLPSTLIHIEK